MELVWWNFVRQILFFNYYFPMAELFGEYGIVFKMFGNICMNFAIIRVINLLKHNPNKCRMAVGMITIIIREENRNWSIILNICNGNAHQSHHQPICFGYIPKSSNFHRNEFGRPDQSINPFSFFPDLIIHLPLTDSYWFNFDVNLWRRTVFSSVYCGFGPFETVSI